MKKIFLVLAALATMAAVSCVKDEQNPDALVPEPEPEVVVDYSKLTFNEFYAVAEEDADKFVELYNAGDVDIDLKDVYIMREEDTETWRGLSGEVVKAKSVFLIKGAKGTTERGLKKGLSGKQNLHLELFAPDGTSLDVFQRGEKGSGWGQDLYADAKPDGSWSRIPDGNGVWKVTTPTENQKNATTGTDDPSIVQEGYVPEPEGKVVFNELNGNGDDNQKYWELYNQTDKEVSLEGYVIIKDEKDDEPAWTGGAEDKILAKGYFTIVGAKGTTPDGFQGGFSAGKSVIVELLDAEGNLLDTFQRGELTEAYPGWGDMDPMPKNKNCSFSRVPDGYGDFVYAAPTLGAANGEKVGDIEQTM